MQKACMFKRERESANKGVCTRKVLCGDGKVVCGSYVKQIAYQMYYVGAVQCGTDSAVNNCLVDPQHAHSESGPLVTPNMGHEDNLYSSLYWMLCMTCSGAHFQLNHSPFKNAPKPIAPELSVKRSRSGAWVQFGRKKKNRPNQGVVKAHHQRMSRWRLSQSHRGAGALWCYCQSSFSGRYGRP